MRFTDNLKVHGIKPSIGTVDDAYDNALMETINGLYKTECIRSRVFSPEVLESVVDVEIATSSWVHWYNTSRLHSSLAMVAPVEFEDAFWGKQKDSRHATVDIASEKAAQPI